MDKTEKLKHIILSKYNSVREFSKIVEIPSTTLASALDKGIGGMAVDRIIKICDVLNVDIKTFEPLENNASNNKLSQEETTLLENYNKLDTNDKSKVIDYTNLLSNQDKYKSANKSTSEITATTDNAVELDIQSSNSKNECYTLAAHDDDLTEETKKRNLEKVKNIFKQMDEE